MQSQKTYWGLLITEQDTFAVQDDFTGFFFICFIFGLFNLDQQPYRNLTEETFSGINCKLAKKNNVDLIPG